MIDTLITSKTRIKLLLKFFLNPDNAAYLRGLETEFGESSNSIRLELNRLEDADMLVSKVKGNRKLYQVNRKHPLYKDINSIVRKYFGLDVIVERIAERLGNLKAVYLTGEIAKGSDFSVIDLIFVGEIDQKYLVNLIDKAGAFIKRKIRYLIYSEKEFLAEMNKNGDRYLLVWDNDDV